MITYIFSCGPVSVLLLLSLCNEICVSWTCQVILWQGDITTRKPGWGCTWFSVWALVLLVTKELVQCHEAAVSLSLIWLHTLLAFDLLLLCVCFHCILNILLWCTLPKKKIKNKKYTLHSHILNKHLIWMGKSCFIVFYLHCVRWRKTSHVV